MKNALKGEPILPFPPAANIGGTDPVPMQNAVPTLDPSLAQSPTPIARPAPAKSPAKKK